MVFLILITNSSDSIKITVPGTGSGASQSSIQFPESTIIEFLLFAEVSDHYLAKLGVGPI